MQCLCDKGQYGIRCNAPLSNDETHELLLCAKDFNGEHNSNIQLECDEDATISILYANIGRTRRYSRCSPEDVFDYYPIFEVFDKRFHYFRASERPFHFAPMSRPKNRAGRNLLYFSLGNPNFQEFFLVDRKKVCLKAIF